jgi:hypothetical protein
MDEIDLKAAEKKKPKHRRKCVSNLKYSPPTRVQV